MGLLIGGLAVGIGAGAVGAASEARKKRALQEERAIFNKKVEEAADLRAQGAKAIEGNLANLPGAQDLASKVNIFNQEEMMKMLTASIPEYERIRKAQLGIIEPMLRGELPSDVKDELRREAGSFGVSRGVSGSDFSKFRGLRNLGISSLNYGLQGLSSADQWLQSQYAMTRTPTFDVTRMFYTGPQQSQATTNAAQLAHQANLNVAAAKGGTQAWADFAGSLGGMMTGMGGMGGGGGMGGLSGMFGGGGGSPSVHPETAWQSANILSPYESYINQYYRG